MITWIAELSVVFVHPSGRRELGRIAVGLPVIVDALEAHCAVALDGLETCRTPAIGGDTLQALLLGVRFLGMRLHDFTSRGGRVLGRGDEHEIDLGDFFGVLLRHPEPT